MKVPLLFAALAFTMSASAASSPVRVLYLGKDGSAAPKHCAALMRGLGREAIWFDYTSNPAEATPERLAAFDAVLLDLPDEDSKSLANIDAKRVVTTTFAPDENAWSGSDFLKSVQEKVLNAAGSARRKEWEAFVAQREPEKREKNPFVANYENRPEPITFQEPMSVKASMQRTQVPADMRLELFAAEPDIAKPIAFA